MEGFKRPPAAALGVSPSPAIVGQPVSFDASASADDDGSVVSYDFDFLGDGTPDITRDDEPDTVVQLSERGHVPPPRHGAATTRARPIPPPGRCR